MARTPKATLAVIGAGMAGLTAARLCQKAGLAVTVYDKGRGVGGRCATRRRDDFAFDHGAQFIAASDGDFKGAIRNLMVSTTVQRWKGNFQNLPKGVTPFVGSPGMSAIAKKLAHDLNIYLPVEIAAVVPEPGGLWGLLDTEGRLLGTYDAVLLTCPPEQAKRLTGSAMDRHFDRPVRMRAVWSVMAAFQRPVPTPFDGIVMDGEPLTWAARNSSKPEREFAPETWVLHAGSDITEQFLEHPREEVIGDLLGAFEHWLDEPLPPRMFVTAQRWLYANAESEAKGQDQGQDISVFDEGMGLGLAGDWLNPPSETYYGLQSAWQSGKDVAARIKAWTKQRR